MSNQHAYKPTVYIEFARNKNVEVKAGLSLNKWKNGYLKTNIVILP